jgi:hypothetical protein
MHIGAITACFLNYCCRCRLREHFCQASTSGRACCKISGTGHKVEWPEAWLVTMLSSISMVQQVCSQPCCSTAANRAGSAMARCLWSPACKRKKGEANFAAWARTATAHEVWCPAHRSAKHITVDRTYMRRGQLSTAAGAVVRASSHHPPQCCQCVCSTATSVGKGMVPFFAPGLHK